jgi:hypothetical protein
LHIEKAREVRSLSDDEIKCVFRAIERSRMALKNRVFMLLCLFYGNRSGEPRLAKKEDFDLVRMVWTVPPENHKIGAITRKPILRPITPVSEFLIRLAIQLAGESKYITPSEDLSVLMTHSFCVHFPYNIMQYLRRYEKREMPHRSMHDLRKTARTNLSKFTPWHVAEIALGHVLPGDSPLYDNHDYLAELTKAYSAYWAHLGRLFAESRAEAQPTRRRFDTRQQLDLPGLVVPATLGKIDQLLLGLGASWAMSSGIFNRTSSGMRSCKIAWIPSTVSDSAEKTRHVRLRDVIDACFVVPFTGDAEITHLHSLLSPHLTRASDVAGNLTHLANAMCRRTARFKEGAVWGIIALLFIHTETAAIAARAAIHRRLPTQRLHERIRENVDGRKSALSYCF